MFEFTPIWCTKVDTSQEVAGCFFVAISQDIADRCTIGDENSLLRREQGTGAGAAVAENKPRQGAPFDAVTASRDPAFCVPRGKNAPVGRF